MGAPKLSEAALALLFAVKEKRTLRFATLTGAEKKVANGLIRNNVLVGYEFANGLHLETSDTGDALVRANS